MCMKGKEIYESEIHFYKCSMYDLSWCRDPLPRYYITFDI